MQDKIKEANAILAKMNVPNLPDEVIKLQDELQKKFPNTVTIANLISRNSELLADFMTLVNTNLTTEKQQIKDAKAAVNVMGLDEIYNIFLSASIMQLLGASPAERAILSHGAKSGIAAAELSYWVFDVSRSEAYMAGLMQNVGAIYLSRFDDEYKAIFESQMSNPITGFLKEFELFQTEHTILGAIVCKKWNIDPIIYKALMFHHDVDFAVKTASNQKIKHITALIILSNYVVSSTLSEQYITQEIKNYRDLAKNLLELPDNAMKAATASVLKWGSKL
ncbi:HDOD domain-containing protein [Thiosulfativibrio zosterae]|uniref:HDOD domain-containing protein n=1 Tax=Thiosulfativibrio zosterae TaxID=2675053 RepID=A0A6F8PQ27_9GAMM|nr:HDOD domain-containing protein [Thiosulfativibrio zosterae]BBP44137.1 hypothetical protein THMIRHAT_18830 [Thiosulfativibrio zosterae]